MFPIALLMESIHVHTPAVATSLRIKPKKRFSAGIQLGFTVDDDKVGAAQGEGSPQCLEIVVDDEGEKKKMAPGDELLMPID